MLLVQSGADTQIGQPLVAGAKVVAEVIDLPTKKTMIQKFRRRKNTDRLKGHTQPYVRVKVKDDRRRADAEQLPRRSHRTAGTFPLRARGRFV